MIPAENAPPPRPEPSRVTVVDFDMPFISIVVLLVKWALAAIPAALILFVLGALLVSFTSGIR